MPLADPVVTVRARSWVSGAVLRVDGVLMAGSPPMADELLVESREPAGD